MPIAGRVPASAVLAAVVGDCDLFPTRTFSLSRLIVLAGVGPCRRVSIRIGGVLISICWSKTVQSSFMTSGTRGQSGRSVTEVILL